MDIDTDAVVKVLNDIMEYELAGVVRYTHYSLMVTGPNRLPIVDFMKAQAAESLVHAQQAGEILTGLGGHPTQAVSKIKETHQHDIRSILSESIEHEKAAVKLYKKLAELAKGGSIYIEEYARGQVAAEELHTLNIMKMMRDYQVVDTGASKL